MILKYSDQEILVNIDLAFKEIVSVKALGFEMQSKKSIYSLRDLLEVLLRDLKKI